MTGRTAPSDRTAQSLTDFLEFAGMAERLVARGRAAYDGDETLPLAAQAILLRLGEAVARLDDDFISAHPEVRWRAITAMRNVVAQGCGAIDHAIVWNTLAHELPADVAAVRELWPEVARGFSGR